eukprot:Skav225111  [mRNA]  locus=scaffold6354:27126:35297:+ [translate_table: standard]
MQRQAKSEASASSVAIWSPDCPDETAYVTETSGSSDSKSSVSRNFSSTVPPTETQVQQEKSSAPRSLKSFKSTEKRESHIRMEDVYRVGSGCT